MLEAAFACVKAFEPRVIEMWVAVTATFAEPTAVGSTTTGYTRFHEGATLGTHAIACRYDGRRHAW